ncbi:MAG: oxidoreductase [Rhodothermaceae bacterium]|nr:oxidoreductase [Rhodothermaceae bacterium]
MPAIQPAEPARALVNPTWEVQHFDPSALFIALSIVDENTVWVAEQPGLVARTTDGGQTWPKLTGPWPDTLAFRDIEAFSADEAFVMAIGPGEDSRIYHTADGGQTWRLSFQNEDPNAFFDCFSFWDRNRGFAFSDSHDGEFTIIRTTDGGETWTRVDPINVPDARPGEGSFAASGTCTAAQPGGLGWFGTGASGVDTRVMRTTDYGETWTEAATPIESTAPDEGIASLAFFDAEHGVALGGVGTRPMANVAVTHDGGVTWSRLGEGVLGGRVYGASVVPGTPTPTLVATSPNGSAYSTDGGETWTGIDADEYWSVSFLSPDVGWAVGRFRISRIVNQAR